MGTIRFESTTSTVVVRSPLKGFAAEAQTIEVRRDPILGDTSVLNPFQAAKTGFFGANDRDFIARLAAESARSCIFCGDRLAARTARYPEELVPGGRLSRGEATLLPNLFPLGAHHPLVVLSRAHFLEPSGFTPRLLADGIGVFRDFLRLAHARDPAAAYTVVGANYLLPAGASIVHPHLQMLTTPVPYTRHERLLRACAEHWRLHGTSGLGELVAEERRLALRHAGSGGGWDWLAAFAPQGCNEILAIHESVPDLAELPEAGLEALAAGISRVLRLYGELGLLCFNYALFSVRTGVAADGFRLLLRIVSRQNLSPAYRNDDYFLQKLLQADLIVTPPEELAARLRALPEAPEGAP